MTKILAFYEMSDITVTAFITVNAWNVVYILDFAYHGFTLVKLYKPCFLEDLLL